MFYPLALGDQLFAFFLATSWEKISAALPSGSTRFLAIASDAPEILNLPWELLRPPESDFLGLDPRFAIRRLPGSEKKLEYFSGELRPRPLRLLFNACALGWRLPGPVVISPLSVGQGGAALGGWSADQGEEPWDLISPAPAFAYLPGYRESALRASRAAVGRPQRRAGLATGQQADEGY